MCVYGDTLSPRPSLVCHVHISNNTIIVGDGICYGAIVYDMQLPSSSVFTGGTQLLQLLAEFLHSQVVCVGGYA